VDSNADHVIGLLNSPNMNLGLTQLLREMSSSDIPAAKRDRRVRLTTSPSSANRISYVDNVLSSTSLFIDLQELLQR
jgi:hypothetical protein